MFLLKSEKHTLAVVNAFSTESRYAVIFVMGVVPALKNVLG